MFFFPQEHMTELNLILQGKVDCLDEELRKLSNEEKGENLGPIMEVKYIHICNWSNTFYTF